MAKHTDSADIISSYLIWIFEDEVLPLLELETLVDDTAQYSPRIVHVQIDLSRQLAGFKLLGAEDHMLGGITRVHTRDIPVRILND